MTSSPLALESATVTDIGSQVRIQTDVYQWSWSRSDDSFQIRDASDRVIVTGTVQPAVIVQRADERVCTAGTISAYEVTGDRLRITYDGVNGSAAMTVVWSFDTEGFWLEPVEYSSPLAEDIVSLHYFSVAGMDPTPTLSASYLVHPGVCESPAVSPVIPAETGLDVTTWLGRGASGSGGLHQQWGLPAHYFGGFTAAGLPLVPGSVAEQASAAYCCGLADLPAGDLLIRIVGGRAAPIVRLRGDLWGQASLPGEMSLGARWRWSFGTDYHAAIRAYYHDLVRSGTIASKDNSIAKNELLKLPQFNTWGAQVATGALIDRFHQDALEGIYREFQESGLNQGLFVIDDKWEGNYGVLEHCPTRFPRFVEFLDQARADGHRIGLWAAFMRCDDPSALGLLPEHMLCGQDGEPIVRPGGYFMFDVSQEPVRTALRERIRGFMRRYQPDLVKFDFGYELPSLEVAAPRDRDWAGERLLARALDLVVDTMREINPDVAVMYYSLSPLFADQFDLHSTDDLFLAAGEFPLEVNRRLFFSSALGEIGMPSFGSAGYDTDDITEIWFDSVAVGPIGSLGSFAAGTPESRLTPRQVATYNGLTALARTTNHFRIEPLGWNVCGIASAARTSSWARYENDAPVMVTLRPHGFGGARGCDRFHEDIRTDTTITVASMTDQGITESSRLGLVASGNGQVTIRPGRPARVAGVTAYGLGGVTGATEEFPVVQGAVAIPVRDELPDGTPIEWYEISLS